MWDTWVLLLLLLFTYYKKKVILLQKCSAKLDIMKKLIFLVQGLFYLLCILFPFNFFNNQN